MRINSLELFNIGPHRQLEVSFVTGLIGLFGPQGSGKTTLMGAVYAALTNDFGRLAEKKDEVVNQQAADHEVSRIILNAEHSGTQFRVTRTLAPGVKSLLEIGSETWNKEKDIRERLDSLLASSRPLLDNYVFVDQWKVRDLFQQKYAERAETLSHLCGTRFIEHRHDLLKQQLDNDMRLISEGSANVDVMLQELGDYQDRLNVQQVKHDELTAGLLTPETIEALRVAANHRERILAIRASLPAMQAKLEERVAALAETTRQVEDLSTKLLSTEKALAAARDGLSAASAQSAEHQRKLQIFAMYEQDRLRIAELQTALEEPGPTIPTLRTAEEIDQELMKLRDQASPHQAMIRRLCSLSGQAACPTCEQPLTDVVTRLADARAAVQQLQAEIDPLQVLLSRRLQFDQDYARFTDRKVAINREIAERSDRMNQSEVAVRPEPVVDRVAELEGIVTELEQDCQAYRGEQLMQTRAQASISAACDSLRADLEKSQLAGFEEVLSEEDYSDACATVAEQQELRLAVVDSKARLDELQTSVRLKLESIERANRLAAQHEKLKTWTGLLQRALPTFHRDGLPRRIHEGTLKKVENDINETLADFESPFSVTVSNNLSYEAHFRNGTVVPVRGLSGGQQVILALAFRWVLNSLFANKIGMLVLDEPTAGLDSRHIALLETALRQLGAAARSRGYQIVIITHDVRLERVFDQVISLGRSVV